MILHDTSKDQGGFGAAEGSSQQLTVLREAAGFDVMRLQDAGRDQGGWSGAEGPTLSWQYCRESFDLMTLHDDIMRLGSSRGGGAASGWWLRPP